MISNNTKIIATIGPSCNNPDLINKMIKKGMNVARLNMAHAINNKEVKELVNIIRQESKNVGKHVSILMDIAGPKIRINLPQNQLELKIVKNTVYSLGYSNKSDIQINMDLNFKKLNNSKSLVKVDDGKIVF